MMRRVRVAIAAVAAAALAGALISSVHAKGAAGSRSGTRHVASVDGSPELNPPVDDIA